MKASDKLYAPNPGTPKGCKTKERHAKTLTGKTFSYCGPGTCFDLRKARGDKPINALDACCQKHDAVYNRKDATRKQIQQSDKDLMTCAKGLKGKSLSEKVVTKVMDKVFKAKRFAEDKKVIAPEKMTDTRLYSKEQRKKEGYGGVKAVGKAAASLAGKFIKRGATKGALAKLSPLQSALGDVRSERNAEKSQKRAAKRAQLEGLRDLGQPVSKVAARDVLTAQGWDMTTKVTSAMKAQEIRSMLQPHLAKNNGPMGQEGHEGAGISRKIGGSGIPDQRSNH